MALVHVSLHSTALFLIVLLASSISSSSGKNCLLDDRCEDGSNALSLLQVSSSHQKATDQAPEAHKTVNKHQPSAQMKVTYPFYHTSKEIADEIQSLEGRCDGALQLTSATDSNMSINVATVRKRGASPVNRVFILFGEHSRELISPESGLHFLKTLCSALTSSSGTPDTYTREKSEVDILSVLEDSEFQMVVNGNPVSRLKVEEGSYCLRTNQNGVDLNRNWDEKWERGQFPGSDTNPGPHPFSEPETRIFKSLVSSYKPHTFLTVHSGTRGMYMPWAFDMEHLANRNQPVMMEVLKTLDQQHCQCPYGAAGKEVGYPCPGTCLDWVYDKLSTPYVFAFEIYTDNDRGQSLSERWQEKMKSGGSFLLQSGNHLGHKHFANLFKEYASDFVQTMSDSDDSRSDGSEAEDGDYCFAMFNPDSSDTYYSTVENWSTVYLKMAQLLATKIRNGDYNVTAPPAIDAPQEHAAAPMLSSVKPAHRSAAPVPRNAKPM